MRTLSIAYKLALQSARSQLEYPLDWSMQALSHFLATVSELAVLWALFLRFPRLGGFEFAEVAVFYGMVDIAMAAGDSVSRGFDRLGAAIKSGDFDRLLLRPLGPAFQLMTQELTLRRVGRLLQGALALGYGLAHLPHRLDAGQALLLGVAITSCAVVFIGLWIFQAALTFFTIETLEAMNILTYGGAQLGQHPLSIFPRWMRTLFTAVVPVGLVIYYPGLVIIGRADPLGMPPWVGYAAPLAGPLFLWLSLAAFGRGVRHYTSTGS